MEKTFAEGFKEAKAKAAGAVLHDAVGTCVLKSAKHGTGVANANGMSVWFPYDSATYLKFRSKYLAMDFGKKHKGWVRFLDAYFRLKGEPMESKSNLKILGIALLIYVPVALLAEYLDTTGSLTATALSALFVLVLVVTALVIKQRR